MIFLHESWADEQYRKQGGAVEVPPPDTWWENFSKGLTMENVALVIWGAFFGNFAVQVLVGVVCFFICVHALVFVKDVPKPAVLGFMFSAARLAVFYAILIGMGFYVMRSWLHIRHIEHEPVFLIFSILGILVSLIVVPGKIIRLWHCTHYALSSTFSRMP